MVQAVARPLVAPHQAHTIAELMLAHGRSAPERPALVLAGADGDRVVTFGDLSGRTEAYMAGLREMGLPGGARVMLLAPPDDEIYALALAALGCGMTLVFVDGRAALPRLLAALHDAAPDLVVAPPAVLRWWPLVGALRRARRISVGGFVPGARRMETLARADRGRALPARDLHAVPAIVSFTSASTGRAKAVVRTHAVLLAQHRALAAAFPMDDGANLPGFPAGTLHNLCCGVPSVIPAGDLRAMADADPAAVLARMERHRVTSLSGAPAFMQRLAAHVVERGVPVQRVRQLVVGGGPVGRALCESLMAAFPRAQGHVVYGATEAEPIATATLQDVAAARDGDGFLVGRPVAGTELMLLAADGSPATLGEIVVRGAHVVGNGAWHHTGDVARMDDEGRLWLLGRVGGETGRDRRTWPYIAEAAALSVPGVLAAALAAHPRAPEGELLVALDDTFPPDAAHAALRDALARAGLAGTPVRVVRALPMDARHASKVSRAELARRLARERA